ncbi:MAG: hypothetical protein ACOYNR_15765 [Blastocatellia bacterium]
MRKRLEFPLQLRQRQTRASVAVWPVLFLFLMVGCREEKTVMDRVAPPTPLPTSTPSPTPAAPQPSPTAPPGTPPILPGTSANVPEMLTRPFTPQELDKALEQLPPEVRQQMRGLGYGLSNKPAPVKPNPSSTTRKPSTSP